MDEQLEFVAVLLVWLDCLLGLLVPLLDLLEGLVIQLIEAFGVTAEV
jgi:hypothetical protein